MSPQKQMEQSQDSERNNQRLDRRYGKIGISAVAAAVEPKGDRRRTEQPRYATYIAHESD
jgi:hypothetical protein